MKEIFGFAEYQENGSNGLGYKWLSDKTLDRDLSNCEVGADAKVDIKDINWHSPQYSPSTTEQSQLSKHILSSVPSDLRYTERSVVSKCKCTKECN